jgi:hypothetical protein
MHYTATTLPQGWAQCVSVYKRAFMWTRAEQSSPLSNGLKFQMPTTNGVDQRLRKHRHPSAYFTWARTFHTLDRDQHARGMLELIP